MNKETDTFCRAVRLRSNENKAAINCLSHQQNILSPMMAILRQELDSLVRVIWLLSIVDKTERKRLIHATLSGEKWTHAPNGKMRRITDREMVDLAQWLYGWAQSVYRFGCAFIHLSDFHNHAAEDPFRKLPRAEREDILRHMRAYHGGPSGNDPGMAELASYIPQVFNKIAGNLDCYLTSLAEGKIIEQKYNSNRVAMKFNTAKGLLKAKRR